MAVTVLKFVLRRRYIMILGISEMLFFKYICEAKYTFCINKFKFQFIDAKYKIIRKIRKDLPKLFFLLLQNAANLLRQNFESRL